MEADPTPTTGIVYVLTNPAMPGIVKIGRTTRGSIDVRLNELYSTGVPVPFECAFAGRVVDETRSTSRTAGALSRTSTTTPTRPP